MDFITDLAPCGGFNEIYTCVDKLTKFIKLIPVSIGREPYQLLRLLYFSLSMLYNCLTSLMWFYIIVMLVLQPTFGAVYRNSWALRLHYLLPTLQSWMGRLNVLIRQWNSLSAVLYLSGVYLRIVGANSLAQLDWLSIQLFRILQVFYPVSCFRPGVAFTH